MKKAALHNLGCKVNSYETEAMQELLEQNGYEIVPFGEKADVYIVNTCSVTNIADRKSRQMLHRARRLNPEALVVAAGCYAQAAGHELLKDGSVDILIGNNEKAQLLSILEDGRGHAHIQDLAHGREYEELSINRAAGHTRAFMKIQDGCDQFCSYCIIPYTRGRVRSRKLEGVVREAERLAAGGYQEVVLTGIHLDSYGKDFEDADLLSAVRAVASIDGIRRIRLGSLEPRIMTEAFVKGLAAIPKLCPHFHLSLQSGCDETLRRMNRKYTTEEFRASCERLRGHFDEPALTTDVIVGFPGETEEEFLKTLEFLKEIRFYETHVFKFSRRKGTRADRMEGQVPEPVKNERSAVLLRLTQENSKVYRERLIGRTVEVLMETPQMKDGLWYQMGHTREYVEAAVPGKESLSNQLVRVKVEKLLDSGTLCGTLAQAVGK